MKLRFQFLINSILFCYTQLLYAQDWPTANYARWEYTSNGYGIKNFKIDIQNNAAYTITKIKMRVWVYDDVYEYYHHNKEHTFTVNIGPYDLGNTPNVPLTNKDILDEWRSFEGLSWGAEILDVVFYKTPAQIQAEKEEAERQRLEAERLAREEAERERIRQEQLELERKMNEALDVAREYYKANQLHESRNYYKRVLAYDPNHSEANRVITEINSFFEKRAGEGYTYRTENPIAFNALQKKLVTLINEQVDGSLVGQINFTCIIRFDTNGVNISGIKEFASTAFLKQVQSALHEESMTAIKKYGYFVNAHDEIAVQLEWITKTDVVKSSGKGILNEDPTQPTYEQYKTYISNQTYPFGKYTFNTKVKTMKIDGESKTLTDVTLVDYKRNGGPINAFLSLILPGWGSAKVSNGKHGYLTGTTYILGLGAAGLSKILETSSLSAYNDADNQVTADAAYEEANGFRHYFLISLGVVAATYIHDLTWSIVHGFKNIKSSAYYKKSLVKGPIVISKTPL